MSASTATVTNISRQTVTLILDHPAFYTKEAGWQRTTTVFANYTPDGARQLEEKRRAFPAAITILPGASVSELHPAVAKCSQVPALVARRVLSVKVTEEKPE